MNYFKVPSILYILYQVVFQYAFAQNSENGSWLPVKGNIHVLVVFAEVTNDPAYESVSNDRWQAGQLPEQPDYYFDEEISKKAPKGFLTDYFYQASFGSYQVTGTYFPKLIQVDYQQAAYHSFDKVVHQVNAWHAEPTNKNSFQPKLATLDQWTMTSQNQPKKFQADSLIDCIGVMWRVNSKMTTTSNSGYCSPGNQKKLLVGYKGVNCMSEFVSHANNADVILRHELSHALYGGNNFHTGGAGAGKRTFIPSVGGWSNLSSWDMTMASWNAWDRNRLGWKNPDKKFLTSAFQLIKNDASTNSAQALVEAYSAGSKPSGKINPKAIAAMKELNYDLTKHDSKSVDEFNGKEIDWVVTMGCGDSCPLVNAKHRIDWQIPDPRDMNEDDFRKVRNMIGDKVNDLVAEITSTE